MSHPGVPPVKERVVGESYTYNSITVIWDGKRIKCQAHGTRPSRCKKCDTIPIKAVIDNKTEVVGDTIKIYFNNSPKYTLIDATDWKKLKTYVWSLDNSGKGNGYARNTTLGKRIHNLLLPNAQYVDHINRDSLDNRKCNLRQASLRENIINRGKHSNNTSGYKGVSYDKESSKFKASIGVNGKRKNLGRFDTAKDGAKAYDLYVLTIDPHEEFWQTNKTLGYLSDEIEEELDNLHISDEEKE